MYFETLASGEGRQEEDSWRGRIIDTITVI
jgi:hypothetical protein